MGAINCNPTDNGGAFVSTAAAATANHTSGTITTESLTTAAGADYSFTLTSSNINATSVILISLGTGTNTTLYLAVHSIVPGAGSATFKIRNAHASVALNGTLVFSFIIF